MTDNDWIKQLQTKMDAHQESAPDGLWQDIEKHLPARQARRQPLLVTWQRIAAAAAIALAVAGGGYLMWHESNNDVEKPVIASTVDLDEPVNPVQLITETPSHPRAATPMTHHRPATPANSVTPATSVNSVTSVTSSPPATDNSQDEEPPVHQPAAPERKDQPLPSSSPYHQGLAGNTVKPSQRRQLPMTLELYASNGFNNNGTASMPIAYANEAINYGYMLSGQKKTYFAEDIYQAHHHAPYSLGLSVRLPLNDYWSLTSGVVYTRVKSDLTSSRNSREQTLHYIGIPIGLTCKIWNYKRLHTYAIGGMQADFNVKATLIQNDHAEKLDINRDRVQFSALIGPGVQFDLARGFGVYVEPTARYYINNGSDLQNYFKEKPLNFNLNAGLRFTLQ